MIVCGPQKSLNLRVQVQKQAHMNGTSSFLHRPLLTHFLRDPTSSSLSSCPSSPLSDSLQEA